ncbi:MAG: ADP-glyceromanno-heptose 6-epimerase [Candidatus Omnitrophica bacterium]|nr:ADP-glyceromanno-heptose 6-epimerase [Candidatus Omnitrophota bacterium]MDD5081314.1 ADP-glyceromanno-heptose 6-epimerase [Candidatus Omnitrophota bacterium]MDD5441021.1 ADP-glyceromanno-heptose 6-epimerase [Candidatus Omnitrophota bacterium]
MRVLVTGGAGFVGSNVVKLLESKGAKTIIIDDFSHASFKNLEGVKSEVICADILDDSVLKKLPPVDAVVHEAAITDTVLDDNTKMMTINYNGFQKYLEYCLSKNIRLVYASSAGTYGDGQSPMKEDQKPRPLNTYAYSKYLCDVAFSKVYQKAGAGIVGLRYFNVFGPGEAHKGKSSSMIYQLYLQMREGKNPRVFKFGEQKRDHVYVKDVARITAAAIELKESVIMNVGTGTARSFNDIIDALNSVMGTEYKPEYFDSPLTGVYQDHTQASIELLEKFKLTAEYTLETGVKDYVSNYLAVE